MRRVLTIEHSADGGIGHFGPWLRDGGVEPVTVRPYREEPLPGLSGFDGLIVLGGEMGAWDDAAAPWLPGVRSLLAEAVRTGFPALGICLGAQLMTAACGGEVSRAETPEIGVVDVTIDADGDPLLGDLPPTIPATQWHYDLVSRLPEGARTLASTRACPHQAYRLGPAAWAVQFHPEVRRSDLETWHRSTPGAPDTALSQYDARLPEIHGAARTVATSFAKIIADT